MATSLQSVWLKLSSSNNMKTKTPMCAKIAAKHLCFPRLALSQYPLLAREKYVVANLPFTFSIRKDSRLRNSVTKAAPTPFPLRREGSFYKPNTKPTPKAFLFGKFYQNWRFLSMQSYSQLIKSYSQKKVYFVNRFTLEPSPTRDSLNTL